VRSSMAASSAALRRTRSTFLIARADTQYNLALGVTTLRSRIGRSRRRSLTRNDSNVAINNFQRDIYS